MAKNISARCTLCIVAAICLMGMGSCIEEFNAELPTSDVNLLVVEGTILSDSVSTFYLTKTLPLSGSATTDDSGTTIDYSSASYSSAYSINNATIKLVGTDGIAVDGKRTEDGTYTIDTPVLSANAQYSLQITYNGDTYETDPQTPFPSVPVESVVADQPSPTSVLNVLVTTEAPADPKEIQYYRWTYIETWEVRPEVYSYCQWDSEEGKPVDLETPYPQRGWKSAQSQDIIASSSAYYGNNKIDSYKLYSIDRADRRLYVLYSTEVCQRSLSKAEYEYENERAKIATEMGGLFTPQPSSLPTNIHCTTSSKRAVGYVGCSLNTCRYRLFVNPDNYKIDRQSTCSTISSMDEGFEGEDKMVTQGFVLCAYDDTPGMPMSTSWTRPACVDVRLLGCFTDMPAYWPK